jgi:hypothetical protein
VNFAPIGLSTYKRIEHLKRTLRHLSANKLAKDSELFIFSDHPRPGDEQAVAEVRRFIRGVAGFKKVHIVERERNDRVFNNRNGMKSLLDEYGNCIFLEEDITTSPNFLSYINQGLEYYKDDKNVFAMCGYTPPVHIGDWYKAKSYRCPRFSAWGFGIWKDRYDSIELGAVSGELLNVQQRKRLKSAGNDLVVMVNMKAEGKLEALDIRINFTMAKKSCFVVCPTRSLTNNTGHDGTGIHCGNDSYYETTIDHRDISDWGFDRLENNKKIEKELFFYRGRHNKSLRNLILFHLGKLNWER